MKNPTMHRCTARLLPFCLLFLIAPVSALAQLTLKLTPANADGVYAAGEKIRWTAELTGDDTVTAPSIPYEVRKFGRQIIGSGNLVWEGRKSTLVAELDEPGTVLVVLTLPEGVRSATAPQGQARGGQGQRRGRGGQRNRMLVGAVREPNKISPTLPKPDDFDSFWASKIDELNQIPMNAQLSPADSDKENVEYYKIEMDNIRKTHIYGQLAKPAKPGKFPAILLVQYAGVYALPKTNVTNRAAQGWLALNIMAHDLPFDESQAFYASKNLNAYPQIGNTSRDESYFLRMYLACYRAIEYLSQRDDWDGKNIVVSGDSMGGQQSLVTAGINPKVTAMIALVPAGGDVGGPTMNRAPAYPNWISQSTGFDPRILTTATYFDTANFATRIQCPALIGMGLIDETCPPGSVFAAAHEIKSAKELVVLVDSPHQNVNNSQVPFQRRREEWLSAITKGEPIPMLVHRGE